MNHIAGSRAAVQRDCLQHTTVLHSLKDAWNVLNLGVIDSEYILLKNIHFTSHANGRIKPRVKSRHVKMNKSWSCENDT